MKFVFISGISTAGKSHLAHKVANSLSLQHVAIDDLREEMNKDLSLKKWVDFFWNQDEAEYWRTTNCGQQWENLKNQSEAFWPTILEKIVQIQKSTQGAIFEGVNILPHLARRDLKFSGVVLLGESYEQILERNKKEPRWGATVELQTQEAKAFWGCERQRYEMEAKIHGYKAFSDIHAAEAELIKLLNDEQF